MKLKNAGFSAAVMLTIFVPATSHAQGVFDLGSLTNTLTVNAGTTQNSAKAPALSLDTLDFQSSPQLSKDNIAKFIAGLKQASPDVGTQLEQGLSNVDLFAEMDKELAKYGLRTTNMGDAMVIYWVASWMAANGRTEEPTRAQIDGTRQMLAGALGSAPGISNLSDAEKQSTSQAMLLQFFLNEIMLGGLQSEPAALKKVRADIKLATKEVGGLDIDQFDMTANGLARKK